MDPPRTCLGIPLPEDIMDFISTLDPPVCLSDSGDTRVMRLIQDFGTRNKCNENEILKAQELAAGLPDIAVLLQRPIGKYNLPFSQFVEDCETLKAVDELIRVATRGARSIYTTTVIDLYMLKPKQSHLPSDRECFELLGKILEIKRPKVVLCCLCKKEATGYWVDKFMSSGIGTGPVFEEYQDKVPITTTRFYSFHPSKAMNYEPCDVYYRILLMMHFIFAFRRLASMSTVPEGLDAWMKEISNEAKSSAHAPLNLFYDSDYMREAAKHLRVLLGKPEIEPNSEALEQAFNRLPGHEWTGGGLAIAKLILLLEKLSPRVLKIQHNKVKLALVILGNEQESFKVRLATTDNETLGIETLSISPKD